MLIVASAESFPEYRLSGHKPPWGHLSITGGVAQRSEKLERSLKEPQRARSTASHPNEPDLSNSERKSVVLFFLPKTEVTFKSPKLAFSRWLVRRVNNCKRNSLAC